MNYIIVDGIEVYISRLLSVMYVRTRIYPTFCIWHTSGCRTMQICIYLCIVVPDMRTWQFVWYVVGGTAIFRCHPKFLYIFNIHVWSRFSWFLAYAEVSDQYIQYMPDTRYVYQKRQMRSDTQIRMPEYDEMVGTWLWKLTYSEKTYWRFMSDDLLLSPMNDYNRTRPFSDGTTDVTCRSILVS